MKMRTEYTCPLELVHDMIKGKWKPIILWCLRFGAGISCTHISWEKPPCFATARFCNSTADS